MRYKHNIQLYENDCGTACVISCLNYYGYTVDYEKIKKGINNNDYGTSINDIKTFFISNGFESKIFKIDEKSKKNKFKNISNKNLPCILFLERELENHYIVLYKILSNEKCIISDPSHPKIEKMKISDILKNAQYILSIEKKTNSKIQSDILKKGRETNIILDLLIKYKKELSGLVGISFLLVLVNILLSSVLGFFIDNLLPNLKMINGLTICIAIMIYVLVSFSDTYLNYLKIGYVQDITNNIEYYLYHRYINNVLNIKPRLLSSLHSGELINRLKEGMNIVDLISMILTRVIVDVLLIIIAILILFKISSFLGIIHLIMCVISIIIVKIYFNRIYENSYNIHKDYANLDDKLISVITNLENEKIYNREEIDSDKVDFLLKKYIKNRNVSFKYSKSLTAFQGIISQITNFSTILIGMVLINNKILSLGLLIVFINISNLLIQAVLETVNVQVDVENQMISYKRFIAILNINNDDEKINNNDIGKIKQISLKDYSLGYGLKSLLINSNADFKIENNNIIVGKSGSGKSSLAKSIIGLNESYLGNIYFNNINIKYLNGHYIREKVVYLSNDIPMVKGTIINFLTDGKNVMSNKVLTVCHDLNILDFIMSLPNQFNYEIQKDGSNLSLGQKQRLSIAYGILKNPDVIIFDETFSNIDDANKNKILENLDKYNILKIYITHQKLNVTNKKKFEIKKHSILQQE